MRKVIMMLGTILIAAVILISGSAVAPTYATSVYSDVDCENSEDALGAPDGDNATVGTNDPDPTVGDLWLDFGFIGIPDSTNIWVYGDDISNPPEYYTVMIYNGDFSEDDTLGTGQSDQSNNMFNTGICPSGSWEFIRIIGTSGSTNPTDPIYGPEIDAVGY